MVKVSVTSRAGPKLPEATAQCLDTDPCVPKKAVSTKLVSRDSDVGDPKPSKPWRSNKQEKVLFSKPEAHWMRLWFFTALTRNTGGDSTENVSAGGFWPCPLQRKKPVHT